MNKGENGEINKSDCPICHSTLKDRGQDGDQNQFDCPNCGRFILSGTAKTMVKSRVAESPIFSAILSHAVRRMQRIDEWPLIASDVISRLEKDGRLPDPVEQGENLVLWLGQTQEHPGDKVEIEWCNYRARIGAFNENGVAFILKSLVEQRLIEADIFYGGAQANLSFDGWKLFNKLLRRSHTGPRAFMAMPFGITELDQLYRDYFKPAVAAAGFDLVRLDEEPQAGSIDERLRVEIRKSRFIVADLTHGNPGAYWEAGFAEGLGKPVIYTCKKTIFDSHGTHFDTNHLQTVVWAIEQLPEAAEELKTTVRATLPDEARMNDAE